MIHMYHKFGVAVLETSLLGKKDEKSSGASSAI
jgi:hypothetical protein